MDKEIAGELKQILASEFFRSAKRSRDFLKYVVEATCAGKSEHLKERTLGIEIFDRDATYDTGEDAIVRVKANEIRRRLAQYELSADPRRPVRIILPPGSYVPQFIRTTSEVPSIEPADTEPADTERVETIASNPRSINLEGATSSEASHQSRYRHKLWISLSVIAVTLILCVLKVAASLPQSNPLRGFWNPLIEGQAPLLICIGYPTVYLPIKGESQESRLADNSFDNVREGSLLPQAAKKINVVGVPDAFVAIGDADAGFLIGRALQSLGRSSQIRTGNNISFADLKNNQVVLIGAYSNKWTLLITNGLRFSFAERDHRRMIIDHSVPNKFWADPTLSTIGKTSEDYALVSRIFSPKSERVIISVAGISQYGSQAAAEFVTDPTCLKKVLQLAPKGWKGTNLQLVLKTNIVGDTPEDAQIIDTYFW